MRPELFEWAPHTGLLCITTYNTEAQQGIVAFWAHTGEKKEKCAYGRECEATCISWHPQDEFVAAGWKDGGINLLAPQETEVTHTVVQDPTIQQILKVTWSHDGKYLCALEDPSTVSIFLIAKKKVISTSRVLSTTLPGKALVMCRRIAYDEPIHDENGDALLEEDEDDMKEFNDALRERNRKIGVALVRHSVGTEFVFGLENGQIIGVDNTGKERNLHKVDSGILFIDYYEARSLLILLTNEPLLYHLVVASDGACTQKLRVKLPGQAVNYRLYINEFLLLICNCERSQVMGKSNANVLMVGGVNGQAKETPTAQIEKKKPKDATSEIRIWDLETDDNGTIALLSSRGFDSNDSIECITANLKRGIISAGTTNGKVASWKRKKNEKILEASWKLQAANKVGEKVLGISWCPLAPSLAVVTETELVILEEDNVIVRMRNKISAVQTSATTFILLNVSTSVNQELKLPMQPKGIHLGDKQLVVWNGETIMTYDVQSSLATIQSTSFACAASDVVIFQQTLYCIEEDKINSRTLQGTVRQIFSLPEMEGNPVQVHLNKNWLAVATSTGFLRIYNLATKDAHQEYHAKYAVENVDKFHSFIHVRINITGNKVAFTYRESNVSVADRIMVWDAEGDNLTYFSFNNGMTDQQEYDAQAELAHTSSGRPVTAAARKMEKEQNRYRMMLHRPGELQWDENDARYLVAEAIHQQSDSGDHRIISMFITSEHGILLQDMQLKSPHSGVLISVCVPYLYFAKKSELDEEDWKGEKTIGRTVLARILKEFSGCESCDDATRKAMMDFCFYLTLGKMDDAFKAIQFVKSESVWEEMSSMSVKTRRLDVAAVCLGHMRNVRGARALRRAQEAGESEAMQCAALALELGMLDEAENLYAMSGRFDMVNKINQAQNAWSQAFDISERKDRIHLRNTYYNYAKYLEDMGAIESAIDNYERAEVHQFEVSRIYADNPRALENYVRRKRDPELHRWWANYLESIGELEGAVNFYLAAKDNLAVVRIKIIQGKHKEAANLAEESNDRAACFKMGRFFEGREDFQQAVNFYSKAHAYSSAIRIAKEHDMKDKLANLCLMAGESEMVEAARYYEELPGYAHKAVMLYHKAGMIGRALDLAFRTEQFSALDLITKDFDTSTNPSILKRAAEFFAGNQNYEKAVQLLSMAKQYRDAVNLCRQRNVRITENFAELLTPTKEAIPNDAERKNILISIAELCLQQGSYSTAAKKLTQAGDTLRAMRALIKSGDTEKIRFFANTARKKEIYILAANYLQTTNWQAEPDVIRDIETFYSKAQSFEHLANFYKSCAYMEAENWKAFDRAKQALEMAAMCVQRAREKEDRPSLQETEHEVAAGIAQMTKLEKASSALTRDPPDGIRQLTALAEEAKEIDLMTPQRIYAIIIEEHASKNNFSAAYRVINQFQKKFAKFDLTTIVPITVLNQICDEMHVERIKGAGPAETEVSDDENEVEFSHAMKRMQSQKNAD